MCWVSYETATGDHLNPTENCLELARFAASQKARKIEKLLNSSSRVIYFSNVAKFLFLFLNEKKKNEKQILYNLHLNRHICTCLAGMQSGYSLKIRE